MGTARNSSSLVLGRPILRPCSLRGRASTAVADNDGLVGSGAFTSADLPGFGAAFVTCGVLAGTFATAPFLAGTAAAFFGSARAGLFDAGELPRFGATACCAFEPVAFVFVAGALFLAVI